MMSCRIFRAIFAIAIFKAFLLLPLTGAFACVGARALALGGAFTGVADDTQATYWNPAGLAKADSGIVTMHTMNLRREFNYDDYVGVSFSRGNWGLGLEYVGKSMQIERENVESVKKGQQVGIKVPDRVRQSDEVYKIVE